MHFDFSAFLVIATFLTGIIWLADSLFFARKRSSKEPLIVEYSRSFFPVILAVLVIRSFLFEPFRIPSSSMMPTLLIGDFILVNKFAYGVRLPVIDTKIIEVSLPQRGDVVVFRYPEDPSLDYIKRLIGLPGDKISYRGKTLLVNGEPMDQVRMGPYVPVGTAKINMAREGARPEIRSEQLSDVKHDILLDSNKRYSGNHEFIVPEGEYFVMGDNRDNSNDSRYWGTVPEENFVGKALLIWMNWDTAKGGKSFSRIGTLIK